MIQLRRRKPAAAAGPKGFAVLAGLMGLDPWMVSMNRNPILDLPLNLVIRSDIALPLQHVYQLYTVGNFLSAWRNPRQQRSIEQMFESPAQARHAAQVCSAWLGVQSYAAPNPVPEWWPRDERRQIDA